MKKKLIALTLILLLTTSFFTSCGDDVEYGDIHKSNVSSSDEDDSQDEKPGGKYFTPVEDTLGYKYKYINIGRANLSLPYPSTWKVTKETDYKIKFKAPSNDPHFPNCTFYFRSTFETTEPYDAKEILDPFDLAIQGDTFTYEGKSVKMLPSSEVEQFMVDTRICKPEYNLQMHYRDWDANIQSGGNFEEKPYFQKTTYLWYKFPCLLTGMVPQEDADKLYDLLVYMMSNGKFIDDEIEETRTVQIFNTSSKMSFPLSTLYNETDADPGELFERAVSFICPDNTGTGYSHSMISIYETKKSEFEPIREETFQKIYRNLLLRNAFGLDDSDLTVYGYLDPTMTGTVKFGKYETSEYVYRFSLDNVPSGSESIFDHQQWMFVIYPITHGDTVDIVVLTTTEDGLVWTYDCIELMSKYIGFGKE